MFVCMAFMSFPLSVAVSSFNLCPFDYTAIAGSSKVWVMDQVNNTKRCAVVIQMSIISRCINRYVIEHFVGVSTLSLSFCDCSFGYGFFS